MIALGSKGLSRWRVILNHWGWLSIVFFVLIFGISFLSQVLYDNYMYTYDWVEKDGSLVERERESRYYQSRGKLYWRHNSIDSPYIEMPEADLDSFVVYSQAIAADKNHVYSDKEIQSEIDRASFNEIGLVFYKDQNNLYRGTRPIQNTDQVNLANIVALPFDWFVDGDNVYRLDRNANQLNEVNLDPDSFSVLDSYYQKDINGIYYQGESVDGVDPSSFSVFAGSKAAKDSQNIIVGGEIIETIDYDSFVVEQYENGEYTSTGRDINGKYNLMSY